VFANGTLPCFPLVLYKNVFEMSHNI